MKIEREHAIHQLTFQAVHKVATKKETELLDESVGDLLDRLGLVHVPERFQKDIGILIAQLPKKIQLKNVEFQTLPVLGTADDEQVGVSGGEYQVQQSFLSYVHVHPSDIVELGLEFWVGSLFLLVAKPHQLTVDLLYLVFFLKTHR
jgi:hypothetical protein